MSKRNRLILIAVASMALAIAITIVLPPIPQPQWYHDFADQRAFLGIPNFLDVASNVAFLVIAAIALAGFAQDRIAFADPAERWPYIIFFLGILFTAFTSAWYHLAPADHRLAGDRLTLSLAIMGWVAAQVQERISLHAGRAALFVLVVAGPASVIYWIAGEGTGTGDLRAYAFLHFFPLLLIPLLLKLFPPRYSRGHDVLYVLGLYALALLAEWLDRAIFLLTGFISGHTLKHLIAAFAAYRVLVMLKKRRPLIPMQDSLAMTAPPS